MRLRSMIVSCLLFFCLCTLAEKESTHAAMLRQGRTWVCHETHGKYEVKAVYHVAGDTLVDGQQCMLLEQRMYDKYTGEELQKRKRFLQETDGKVTELTPADSELLCDFTLEAGDPVAQRAGLSVIAVDTLYVNGRAFRRLVLADTSCHPGMPSVQYWVEGIGSMLGTFYPVASGVGYYLQTCTDSDGFVFRGCDFAGHRPLLQEGKMWHYKCYDESTRSFSSYRYLLSGDTLIGGKNYSRLCLNTATNFRAALREEGKKVFCVQEGTAGEQLLYDFGAGVDDSVSAMGRTGIVDQVMMYKGMGRLDLAVVRQPGTWRSVWLTGVGCLDDLLTPLSEKDGFCRLESCEVNGRTLYSSREYGKNDFLVEGKTWVYGYFGFDDSDEILECMLHGDTIIGGVHFMRKYEKHYRLGSTAPAEWESTDWYLGQEGNKLYHYCSWPTYSGEKFMFMDLDFSKQAGDVIEVSGMPSTPWTLDVLAVGDTIMENTTGQPSRHCMTVVGHGYEGTDDVWIEGIGSVTSGVQYYTLGLVFGKVPQLLKCYVGDDVLYEHPFDHQIPLRLEMQNATSSGASALYDLQGRRLSLKPARGLYIKDGRKYLGGE